MGLAPFGIAGQLVTVAILMSLAMRLAKTSVTFIGIPGAIVTHGR